MWTSELKPRSQAGLSLSHERHGPRRHRRLSEPSRKQRTWTLAPGVTFSEPPPSASHGAHAPVGQKSSSTGCPSLLSVNSMTAATGKALSDHPELREGVCRVWARTGGMGQDAAAVTKGRGATSSQVQKSLERPGSSRDSWRGTSI